MADWLRELKQELNEDDTFFEQMDRQLAAAFAAEVGERLDDFVLLGPMEPIAGNQVIEGRPQRRFTVKQEGARHLLEGELLNIDYLSAVTIAWTRAGGAVDFSWQRLDADDIRSWLAARRRIPIDIKPPVMTEIRNPVWPHVTLTFEIEGSAPAARIEETLHAAALGWDPAKGAIHNAGPLRQIDARTFSMAVDFGSAGPDALNHMLNALAETVPIKKVTLHSGP